MALQAAGPISIEDIVAEFRPGYSGPANLEEYYRNGTYVPGNITGRTDIQTLFGSGTRANNPNPSATLPEIFEVSLDEDFTTLPLNLDVSESFTSLVSQDQVSDTGVFVTGGTRVTSSQGGFSGGSGSGGVTATVTTVNNALALTNVGFDSARGWYQYEWTAPAGGATIDITLNARQNSGSLNPGTLSTQVGLFTITRDVVQGRVEDGRTNFNPDGSDLTFVRSLRTGADGGLNVNYRFQATVPAGRGVVAIGATLRQDFNPPVTLVSNNSTFQTFSISYTNTNTYSVTLGAGTTGAASAFTLGPSETSTVFSGQTTNSPTIVGESIFIGAQGLFSSGTTRGVTATTESLSSRFNPVTLTGSGQSVSAVNIPAGEVDFTLSSTSRTDGNLEFVFDTNTFDASGLTLTPNPNFPFRVGDGTPATGLGAGRSGYVGSLGVGNVFTLRVTGTIPSARTWNGYAGSVGGAPSHANGVITVTNNALSQTVASGNNDLSTSASERSLGSVAASGGSFSGGVDDAARADAWYVRFGAATSPADYEITGVTVTNDRTGQSAAVGVGNSNYYQGPAWLNNDGTTPTNVVGNLIPNLSAFPGGIEAGDTFTVNQCSGFRCGSATVTAGQRTRSVTTVTTQFSVTASNSNSYAIVLNDSSTGGGGTVPANGSLLLTNTATADGWSLGWDQQGVPSVTVNTFSAHNTNDYPVTVNGTSVAANTPFASRVLFADSLSTPSVTARVQANVDVTSAPTFSLDLDTDDTVFTAAPITGTFPVNSLGMNALGTVRDAVISALGNFPGIEEADVSAITQSGGFFSFTINTNQNTDLNGQFTCTANQGRNVTCRFNSEFQSGNLMVPSTSITVRDPEGTQVTSFSASSNQTLSSIVTQINNAINAFDESPPTNYSSVISADGENIIMTSGTNATVAGSWTATVDHGIGAGDIAFGATDGDTSGNAARTQPGIATNSNLNSSIPTTGTISLEDFYGTRALTEAEEETNE